MWPASKARCRSRCSLDEPRLEWAGSSLATVFRAEANAAAARTSGGCCRHPALQPRERRLARAGRRRRPVSLRGFLAAGGYGAPSPTGTCCRWRPRSGRARPGRCSTIRSPASCASAATTACCRSSTGRPQWRTVQSAAGAIREQACRVARRCPAGDAGARHRANRDHVRGLITLRTDAAVERYDQVVLACHSDQALAILGDSATQPSAACSGAIRYAPNRAVLHTDPRCCRVRRRCGRRGTICRAAGTRPAPGQRLLPDQSPAAAALRPRR
jgi:hypothetical protein